MAHVAKKLAWLTALLLPGIAAAQTKMSPALATIEVTAAALTLTKGSDLRFPDAFPGQGSVKDNGGATWSVTTTQGVNLSITFTLPTALNGPGANTIPLAYGSTSGTQTLSTGQFVSFDPSTGTTVMGSNPSGQVLLGQPLFGTADELVTASVGTVAPGNYSATIVLTIAVL